MGERASLLSLTAMGSIMMIAMMLPAAIPWIIEAGTGFAAGYGLIWMAFGAAAAAAQWRFGSPAPILAAAVVLAALFYERTPRKHLFLRACTSERVVTAEGFKLGVRQGMQCVGCCWLLMAALFAFGATNLVLTFLVTAYVVAQRLLAGLSTGTQQEPGEVPRMDRFIRGIAAVVISALWISGSMRYPTTSATSSACWRFPKRLPSGR
jgi:predicted metal-binding membrane protein